MFTWLMMHKRALEYPIGSDCALMTDEDREKALHWQNIEGVADEYAWFKIVPEEDGK